ncbi:MAG: type II secretion system GspH family protein [Planctomycetaceae bacterium]|nr:type II secretion system GspH family protein [Planctomycetaceae bacterium]
MGHLGKSKRYRAFTLVELLVVISIIALLLAVLMPALTRARESAKVVMCKANTGQILLAAKTYGMDNKDYFTPLWVEKPDVTPPGGYWYGNYWFWPQIMSKNLGEQFALARCPNGRSTQYAASPVHGNYGLNINLTGNGNEDITNGGMLPVKQMNVRQPGNVMLVCDSGTFYAQEWMSYSPTQNTEEYLPGSDTVTRVTLKWPDVFATKDAKKGRHPLRGICMGFVDGHSEILKVSLLKGNSLWYKK